MFIDTHCHLYAEEFDEDRHEVVERARQAGAEWLLLPNIDANSLGPLVSTCDEWPDLCRPMLGLHPTALPPDPQPLLDRMEQLLALPTSPFVAVGEVGVDLYWDSTRREEQMDVFRRQAEWSIRFNLPLIIHSRSAHAELLEVLTPFKHELPGGIFHCFGGSAREAEELLAFSKQLCRSSASCSKPMRPISHQLPTAANATNRPTYLSSSNGSPMSIKPHRNA